MKITFRYWEGALKFIQKGNGHRIVQSVLKLNKTNLEDTQNLISRLIIWLQ